uniref:C-type lectin domain-containing protein n=1 Tax=Cavia porcellus TaxID=10141 RepID=A0A286Y130_CAVPO|nr:C-type lectin domain family 4 member C-like [Cavia porcellus]
MVPRGPLQGTERTLQWHPLKVWFPAVMSISVLGICFILSTLVNKNNSVYSNIGKRLSKLQSHQRFLSVACRREAEGQFAETWSCCPTPWKLFESSCYFIASTSQSWEKSRESCIALQADLAVIRTQEEQDFIIQNLNNSSAYYLGLSDPEGHRHWQWVDQTPYTNVTFWHEGEPNQPTERCVVVAFRPTTGRWGWNDIFCDVPQKSLCRMPVIHL